MIKLLRASGFSMTPFIGSYGVMYLGYVKAVIYRFLSVVVDIGWVWNFISMCFLK